MTFRTGDVVWVGGLEEEWLVAMAERGFVTCCGWPETMVVETDCRLIKAASDAERLALLEQMAGGTGPRGAYARRTLQAEGAR